MESYNRTVFVWSLSFRLGKPLQTLYKIVNCIDKSVFAPNEHSRLYENYLSRPSYLMYTILSTDNVLTILE